MRFSYFEYVIYHSKIIQVENVEIKMKHVVETFLFEKRNNTDNFCYYRTSPILNIIQRLKYLHGSLEFNPGKAICIVLYLMKADFFALEKKSNKIAVKKGF